MKEGMTKVLSRILGIAVIMVFVRLRFSCRMDMNDKYKPEEIVDLKAQARFVRALFFIGFFFVNMGRYL